MAWNVQDSLTLTWPEQRITFVLLGVYRNILTWPTWTTARTKDTTPRSLQQLTTPLPQLAFKRALLTAFGKFRLFKAGATRLLTRPCNKPFSAPNCNVSVLFGLLCVGHRCSYTYIRQNRHKVKTVTGVKEGHFIMIKGLVHQEKITIINIYTLSIRAAKYTHSKHWQNLRRDIDSNTIIEGNFNTTLSVMGSGSRTGDE